jgi:hypothetical protein
MRKVEITLSCLTTFVLILAVLPVGAVKRTLMTPDDQIEKGVFIDYRHSSPPWYPPTEETDSYKWAPKYYWANPSLTIKVNPTASPFETTEHDAVVSEIEKGFEVWDGASGPFEVTVSRDDAVGPSLGAPDYENTVSWGTIDGSGGIIAITYFWYYVNTKELIDCDIVFDAAEDWSISPTVPPDKFDVWNIAAHEAGHCLVLQDLKSPKDGALTMHAYTWLGDDLKRDLGLGDILGIQTIYGE